MPTETLEVAAETSETNWDNIKVDEIFEKPAEVVEPPPEKVEDGFPVVAKSVEVPRKNRDAVLGDDFTPEEKKLLKSMPNSAFDYVLPRIKEAKQLATIKADYEAKLAAKTEPSMKSYIEHENAYMLNESYSQQVAIINLGHGIVKHFAEQLAKIERGEQWNGLTQDAQGNVVIDPTVKEGNTEAKIEIMQKLNHAQTQLGIEQANMQRIQQEFKQTSSLIKESIIQAEDKMYARYKDPTAPQYKLVEKNLALIPKELRQSPLAGIVAKAGALNWELASEVRRLTAELATVKKGKAVVVKQGPVTEGGAIAGGKSGADLDADYLKQMRAIE